MQSPPSSSDGPYPYQANSMSALYPPNKAVSPLALSATCHPMNGIGQPLSNTTKRPKALWYKPFIALSLHDKSTTIHPKPAKTNFLRVNTKKPQIVCFHWYFICKPLYACMTPANIKANNLRTILLKICCRQPSHPCSLHEAIQPLVVSSHPAQNQFTPVPGI